MANIPLVDDSFVPILEFMMQLKDIEYFEVVLALYTITHCVEGMFEEIAEEDLPDALRSDYRSVRSSICALTESIKQYRDDKMDAFLSACEE